MAKTKKAKASGWDRAALSVLEEELAEVKVAAEGERHLHRDELAKLRAEAHMRQRQYSKELAAHHHKAHSLELRLDAVLWALVGAQAAVRRKQDQKLSDEWGQKDTLALAG